MKWTLDQWVTVFLAWLLFVLDVAFVIVCRMERKKRK